MSFGLRMNQSNCTSQFNGHFYCGCCLSHVLRVGKSKGYGRNIGSIGDIYHVINKTMNLRKHVMCAPDIQACWER